MSRLKINRALISVYHKDKIIEFAKFLQSENIEIISSVGTYKMLKNNNIESIQVDNFVGSTNSYNGIIKTLFPVIFAAILNKRDKDFETFGIKPIDLVVVNFYPYEQLVKSGEKSINNLSEMIDIGGPTLLRAAGKNYNHVCPLSAPEQYHQIMNEIKEGGITLETRHKMAIEVFKKTAKYDKLISETLLF